MAEELGGRMPPRILIEIGPGELIDRISILALKAPYLAGPARARVEAELARLRAAAVAAGVEAEGDGPVAALAAVNAELWGVEAAIRGHEARGDFGPGFVELARSVYRLNDRRSALKREIDRVLGVQTGEVKIYAAPGGSARPGHERAATSSRRESRPAPRCLRRPH
jgi:hypothetical protein